MDDRTLIERAAKAAGIEIDKSPYNGGGLRNTGFDLSGNAVLDWHNYKTWNPLTDDGDALRLAVQLKVSVHFETHLALGEIVEIVEVTFGRDESMGTSQCLVELVGSDPGAATRRAITRAAAALAGGEG